MLAAFGWGTGLTLIGYGLAITAVAFLIIGLAHLRAARPWANGPSRAFAPWLLGASVVAYSASMFLPVMRQMNWEVQDRESRWDEILILVGPGGGPPELSPDKFHPGWHVFLFTGKWSVMARSGAFYMTAWTWYANPLLWLAWCFFLGRLYGTAAGVALVAMLLGIDAVREFWASGGYGFDFYSGYYVWLGSMALLILAGCWDWLGGWRPPVRPDLPGRVEWPTHRPVNTDAVEAEESKMKDRAGP